MIMNVLEQLQPLDGRLKYDSQYHASLADRCAGGGLCRVSEGLHRFARTRRAAGPRGRSPAAALPQTLLACRGMLLPRAQYIGYSLPPHLDYVGTIMHCIDVREQALQPLATMVKLPKGSCARGYAPQSLLLAQRFEKYLLKSALLPSPGN